MHHEITVVARLEPISRLPDTLTGSTTRASILEGAPVLGRNSA